MSVSNEEYIISIDQSTSATKGILYNTKGEIYAENSISHKQYYPKPGWVEHDPEEIYINTLEVIKNLITQIEGNNTKNIIGLTITNQRETVVVWDRKTGKPVYNAIVWQCIRGKEICEELKNRGIEEEIKRKTGLILDPYFSASKIKWILDNISCKRNDILLGTIDCWLIWKLTKGKVHATDFSNASRTLLFNIDNLKWDEDILEIFNIPKSSLPQVLSSNSIFGYTNCDGILNFEIPISGIIGDSQSALFGEGCFEEGMSKVTYGTGSSIAMNIGDKFILPPQGIVTSIGWGINDNIIYIFEGNVHSTGATIKWLKDNLGIIQNMEEIEEICFSLKDNEGVYIVPAFSGLGAPYWNSNAKGIITGLTFKTTKDHIIRAGVESIAFQIKDVLEVFEKSSGKTLKEIRADGGATKNKFLMQFQADILGIPVYKAFYEDMSSFGSFVIGGLGLGIFKDIKEISKLIREKIQEIYYPQISIEEREKRYKEWKDAVKKVLV
ncbi:MAG: glycerol kinase GlpK [Dictyoglomaceae bacterium]|nr:glycerol kinase GlpK [Dictyoglomaceae bacterium]